MRIIFAGTPELAIPTARALLAEGHQIPLVITRTDAPQGRKRVLTPSPVALWADERGIPTLKINSFTEDAIQLIAQQHADLGVVVAYGGLIPQTVLDIPESGWLNLHFSALPDLRGAAPVQRALMRGDTTVSTSVFQLVASLDAGPVFSTETSPVMLDETAGDVLQRLSLTGAGQTAAVVAAIATGTAASTPQDGGSSYAPKLTIEDAAFNPDETGRESYSRFRGVTPEPGMWFMDGEIRVKVLEARLSAHTIAPASVQLDNGRAYLGTATVALELVTVQPAGKQQMRASDWLRGRKVENNS